ncbi:class I SAM-dependent methyltransferase [Frankia sp. CNm7]|nr:class I SAM-dependent methyltransferase [Frankia nepalensis]MBL7510265.1 class I SAM-dependent methyltransferase [Frankia nepalensis]MBL7520479.1 class I SAM-dependent methyltransferase [Frankia nepalensis]
MAKDVFLDPVAVQDLYRSADRLSRRTDALHQAKITGSDVAAAIPTLLRQAGAPHGTALDIGCGRGTTTLRLATAATFVRLVAIDVSPALLATTRRRLQATALGASTTTVCADFHCLPIRSQTISAVVAAFCLYHSPRPATAVAEIARVLAPGGIAVLVTKSLDSYAELDDLVARAELDPQATRRPSLYETFHSASIAAITATGLSVLDVLHERHVFRFAGHAHAAVYLATSPKYQMGAANGDPDAIATALRSRLPDRPIETASTVSYAIARCP